MKYCPKCKKMYQDSAAACGNCKKPVEEIKNKTIPVFLLSTGGVEKARIKAALDDAGIPYSQQTHKKVITAAALTGAELVDVDILVPYGIYEKAYDVCVGIGAIHLDGEQIVEEGALDEKAYENHKAEEKFVEEFEEMSPAKRTTVRIISAILFIGICALVIFGVDAIIAVVKEYFGW